MVASVLQMTFDSTLYLSSLLQPCNRASYGTNSPQTSYAYTLRNSKLNSNKTSPNVVERDI